MKKLIALLLLAFGTGAYGEDVITDTVAPYTERGVSITKYVNGSSLNFTNYAEAPWYPVSIWSDAGTRTNTITLNVVRVYDIRFQYRPDDVTTNILGIVTTNTYTEVTNMAYRVFTGTVASVTITGAGVRAISVPFQIKADDVLVFGQSDTNAKPIVLNGQR
jgi:hypothetical protein